MRPATSAGPAHDRLGDARPDAALAVGAQADQRHAQPQQAAAEDRQQRGQQRQRRGDRDERDEQPADAHRADERQRDQHQAGEPDRDRRAREEHGVAGRAHRRAQRLRRVRAAEQLLAEAVDDEQRVVDRDRDADQRDEVRHVDRRRREPCNPVHDPQRAGDRARREDERHRHRHREAEDPSSTSSATGKAMLSPFVRSCEKIGSRSCWVGPAPVT